jgi:hypothetical protein
MENVQTSKRTEGSWTRSLSFVVTIASTALLLLCLWRWAQGHRQWDTLLTSSALLLLVLPQSFRIEGVPRLVLQFIGLVVTILAIVTLSRSLSS